MFCPKYRFQIFQGEPADYTRHQIESLCRQKDQVEVLELNIQPDHSHLALSIPPKYAVSTVMGFLKGKLALRLVQRYWGQPLWSRGYGVSTVSMDEDKIRKDVKWQEAQDRQAEQTQQQLFD